MDIVKWNPVIEFLMMRDSMTRSEAQSLLSDTIMELMEDPYDVEEILDENLSITNEEILKMINHD